MYGFIFTALAIIFYGLSYYSPKTDKILYALSGILFLVAGVAGFGGLSDVPVKTIAEYSYNVDNLTSTIITTTEYSGNDFYTMYLPIIEFLTGLYILFVFVFVDEKEDKKNAK